MATRPRHPGSRFVPLLSLIAAIALGVRLLYIFVVARAPVGVGGDAGFYHSAANLIADGHFYYRVIFGHAYVTAEHPPLFSLLLSVCSLLGGVSLGAHRIVGCVVGTLSIVGLGVLGREAFGNRAGLLAAGLGAFYPPFITADGLVMSEPLFVLAVVVALLLATRMRGGATLTRCVALGAAIGLCALARSEGLLLVPFLGLPAVWGARPGRGYRAIGLGLAICAVLAPWLIRNAVTFDRLMLAGDASTVIAGANCAQTYYGRDIGWWSLTCLERNRTPAQLREGDASTRAGFDYAFDHPTRLPLVGVIRLLRTFDLYQPLRQGNRELRRRWVDIAGLAMYFPVLVLAGVALLRMRSGRWLWLAPIWMVVVISVFGWGIGRFRVAADASLIVLAAVSLAGAARRRAVPA